MKLDKRGLCCQEVSNQCETCEVVVRLLEGLTEGNHSVLRSVFFQSCPKLPCKYQASVSIAIYYNKQILLK